MRGSGGGAPSEQRELKDKVVNLFDLCDNPDIRAEVADVKVMFDLLSDPFESIASEYRRLASAEDDGHFIKPEPYVMFHRDKYENKNGNVALIREPASGQIVNLGSVLKFLFEIPFMFDSVYDYMNSLLNDRDVIQNFIQGELWQEELASFEGKIAIPLHMHFDDYESGNCLGSHAGDKALGALYASVPCLPPHLSSCVQNMFLSAIFLSNDRKEAANLVAFGSVIDQLIELRENGVLLNLAQGETRVYFCFCLIVADNKGNNAIQGLVECFRCHYYCRMCKMHRDVASFRSYIPNNLLRNTVNYEADIALNDFRQTGVHENCVWNRVPGYHVTRNINCDVLHDVYEGLVNFTLSPMLYYFIRIRNYFDIDILHRRIEGFDFGPDVGNKPPISHITLDRLQADNLNLGGCEMLCLVRYLSEIIGDLVPQNNPFWKLYLLVREIVLIISCPYFSSGTELYLDSLIQEHHELYVRLFNKPMKPRHHLLLHYSRCMRRNGPSVKNCTFTSERKHRQGKLYVRAMNSRVNLPLSVSIKTQLQLSHHFLKLRDQVLNAGAGTNLVYHRKVFVRSLAGFERFAHLLPSDIDQCVSSVQSVNISGTKYCVGMIIVINVADLYPEFAQIVHIVSNNGSDFGFVLNIKQSVMYHEHFAAYEVENTQSFIYLLHQDFVSYVPLWERLSVDGAKFVSLKISL